MGQKKRGWRTGNRRAEARPRWTSPPRSPHARRFPTRTSPGAGSRPSLMESGVFIEFPTRAGMTDREAFAECFALVDAAEALGVNSVWLAEYHFSAISVLSSPITIASAIAARTQRIRIGLPVVLLPLAHPIPIADGMPTLDHISQGRVEFGVGRGPLPATHDGLNSPFAESRGRVDENLEVIVK